MTEKFLDVLAVGGKKNSLGRAEEVVQTVLDDETRLDELYRCLFADDAWVRMRAADALEKVCRAHPQWLKPYVDRFFTEVTASSQPSIQWHLAQILRQADLTPTQTQRATKWLEERLQTVDVDWIVSGDVMETLAQFVRQGRYPKAKLIPALKRQQKHHSKAVVKRATKLLESLQ